MREARRTAQTFNMTSRQIVTGGVVVLLFVAASALSLIEREIFAAPSDINGTVRVSENWRGVRFMRFGSDLAIQSYHDTSNPSRVVSPYVRVTLEAFRMAGRESGRVLVIGMGGGEQAMAARRLRPDAVIDLVDICPVVVRVASDFMGFRSDDRMRVHVADGLRFVADEKSVYDVVMLDAFNGVEPPQHMITREFFESVKARLAPHGVVVVNLVYRDTSSHYDGIVQRLRSVFSSVELAEVPGGAHNRVVFAR